MRLDDWLDHAKTDADRRGLPELKTLLERLARATAVLRHADWLDDAAGTAPHAVNEPKSAPRKP